VFTEMRRRAVCPIDIIAQLEALKHVCEQLKQIRMGTKWPRMDQFIYLEMSVNRAIDHAMRGPYVVIPSSNIIATGLAV